MQENHGKPWKTMENHGKPWKTMENHGKPWKTMENHGKPVLFPSKRQIWPIDLVRCPC